MGNSQVDLNTILQPGMSFSLYWNKRNINNKRVHIRAIVDGHTVVYCYWLKSKQHWWYAVESAYYFSLLAEKGVIRDVRKDSRSFL